MNCYTYFLYIEKNVTGFVTCFNCIRENVRVKLSSGSKRNCVRKFNVFDDDLDLAHKVCETARLHVRKMIFVTWDERPAFLAIDLIRKKYQDVANRIAIVSIHVSHGVHIPFSIVLHYAEYGKYRIINYVRKMKLKYYQYLTREYIQKHRFKLITYRQHGEDTLIVLEKEIL